MSLLGRGNGPGDLLMNIIEINCMPDLHLLRQLLDKLIMYLLQVFFF